MTHPSDFTSRDLFHGCVFATIAHAIHTVEYSELGFEQSWDDKSYNVSDSEGSLGTVTFGDNVTVGAFFDSHSNRSPMTSERPYDLDAMLREMPTSVRELAEREALQYLLQNLDGKEVPLITTVFWSENDQLVASEPWEDVLKHGGHLVEVQLAPVDVAIARWTSNYGFEPDQVDLLRSLYERWRAARDSQVTLTAPDQAVLTKRGTVGLDVARQLLATISIIVP